MGQDKQEPWKERFHIPQSTRRCAQYHNGEARLAQVLLILDVPIKGDQNLETISSSSAQQSAVLESVPVFIAGSDNLMPFNARRERYRNRLIKQNAHAAR